MRAFDASSILYGWFNYPPGQFPRVWSWIGAEIVTGALKIPKIALEETTRHDTECGKWLLGHSIQEIAPTQAIIIDALAIKSALGIVGDKFGGGVGENDLIIIASAKNAGCELVSNESPQPKLPSSAANYKIPAVCAMKTVGVSCIDFLTLLTQSGKTF